MGLDYAHEWQVLVVQLRRYGWDVDDKTTAETLADWIVFGRPATIDVIVSPDHTWSGFALREENDHGKRG